MRAADVAMALGAKGGDFVGKIFMGAYLPKAKEAIRLAYGEVRIMRPEATRSSSYEAFIIELAKKAPPSPSAPVDLER